MLDFPPRAHSEQLNKGSIAQLFEHLSWKDRRKLYENKKFVSRLDQDELVSLAKDNLDIIDDILTNQKEIIEKFPTISFPVPQNRKKKNVVKYFRQRIKLILSILEEGTYDPANLPTAILPLKEFLLCIAEKYEQCAMDLINNKTWFKNRRDRYDVRQPIVRLALAHKAVAKLLFKFPLFEPIFKLSECVEIAEKYEFAAIIICGAYVDFKLFSDQYAALARAHECVSEFVFEKNPHIAASFGNLTLSQCARSPFNAKWLLNPPLENLSYDTIREIAISDLSLAETIFSNPALFDKLHISDIAKIAKAHLPIARRVMKTPDLCSKMMDWDLELIAMAHREMAIHILTKPKLLSKLSFNSQANIARKYIGTENFRFDIPSLLKKLSSTSLKDFGVAHIFVAEYILKTPFLVSMLMKSDLCEIQRTVELYNIILQTLGIDMRDKLYEKSWEHLDPLGKTTIDQLCNKLHNTLQTLIRESTEKDQPQQQAPISMVSQTKPLTKKYSTTHPSQQVSVTDEEMTLSVFGKKRLTWSSSP